MLNIWVSGTTGWTGRELVRGVLEAEDMTPARRIARAIPMGQYQGPLVSGARCAPLAAWGGITGVVRGLDKLLFGAASRPWIAGAGHPV